MVAALYIRPGPSEYRRLGLDVWGPDRDADLYSATWPVVAHPPCGPFGRFAWASKESPKHALYALRNVRRCGGVLEHPAHSALWRLCGLPRPGEGFDSYGGSTILVHQGDFGHPAPKATWLYGVRVVFPALPPRRPDPGGRIERMAESLRERTPPAFARWLVAAVLCQGDYGPSHPVYLSPYGGGAASTPGQG